MCDFMIFNSEDNTEAENENYKKRIDDFAREIAMGFSKGKRVLIITGSGISNSVPGMQNLMNKIVALINDYDKLWKKSEVFNEIFDDYLNTDESEKHQMQSRLLTYIQNAYMGKNKYVQKEDQTPLSDIWSAFIAWLLNGDEELSGIINASPSENHRIIRELYIGMNAISITTNFDNLLQKVFKQENFYPILNNEEFDRYYLSKEDDNSYIEIQSRGDAFWIECTGSKNKTCQNKHRQCFVPSDHVIFEGEKVICNLCNSEAKIYFAFPGTKEKDSEMAIVIDRVWKYLSNTISCIIVNGNSMDYDPILIEFLRELIQKRRIPVLYISRYKKEEEETKSFNAIYKKEATKFLFSNYLNGKNIWARSENTEKILSDLFNNFKNKKEEFEIEAYTQDEIDTIKDYFKIKIEKIFGEKKEYESIETDLKGSRNVPENVFCIDKIKQMRHFSQLGLKPIGLEEMTAFIKNTIV